MQNVLSCKCTRHWLICIIIVLTIILLFINFFAPIKELHNAPFVIAKKIEKPLKPTKLSRTLIDHNEDINKTELDDKCEVIHIGFVCSGYKANVYLHNVLKSIYFYRYNPIHFHIIVNKFSERVLKTLFKSWDIPQVNVTFYDLNDYILDVRWIPNRHYSGIYGLLKLIFPKIVPLNITNRLIIFDTDLTVTGDVFELWQLFKNFNEQQAIGIVENQSNYYLDRTTKTPPWPAIEQGFNSGVLLYHLERLNRLNWSKLWSNITKTTALVYGTTRLGDQDIINAVVKEHNYIYYKVPCYWNTQLSDHTLSYQCYKKYKVKIVHWNSPKKFQVINKDGDYFRSLHTTFVEFNGNLLRRQLYFCNDIPKTNVDSTSDQCVEFRKATISPWRTLLFFREYKASSVDFDVTFVAQLSYDRLQMVIDLVKYWSGPISLTFYITDPEFQQCMDFIENSDLLRDRTNIAYHAVFKDGEYHPINILRNVGLKNVDTPYVFLADIDFLPMKNSYSILRTYLMTMGDMKKKALIVPAFETQRYRTSIPKNKAQLLLMLDNKSIFPFRFDVWQAGHAPTNYTKWKTANAPYRVNWSPDFEPYIVVRNDVTEYDNRFMGFGWNKVSHIMELEAQGYEFVVLPNLFIIHKPHAPSYDIAKFRTSPIYRMCIANLKEEFLLQLNKKYGRVFDKQSSLLLYNSNA